MSSVDSSSLGLPRALADQHVLVLPAGADVLALAAAWFPEAEWLRAPVAATSGGGRSRTPGGARFRGMVTETAAEPGAIRLTWSTELRGPFTLDTVAASAAYLPARDHELYAVVAAEVPGEGPAGGPLDDPQVLGWMRAAARRVGGLIVPAAGAPVVAPDAASAVDLTLWSPIALAAEAVVPIVRPILTGARVAVSSAAPRAGGVAGVADEHDGPPPFELVASYEYDGEVRVTCARATEVSLVLTSLDWRSYGPFAYRVTWHSPLPDEVDADRPSPLHLIARGRIAPHVARAVAALVRTVGGTVVDDGGFLVDPAELAARQVADRR